MSRGVNKVTLVGNLGNDPETKYTQGGQAITKVSLATTTAWRDKDGNQQERTEWHRVVFFGKLGEIADEYLHKGSQIYVEGTIRYGKYTDNDGVERYTTDIIGNEMQMLGERGGGQGSSQSSAPQRQQSSRSQQSSRPTRQPERQARQPAQQERVTQGDFQDDFADDDIPF